MNGYKIPGISPEGYAIELLRELKEAELEAKATGIRYSHEEVFSDLKARVAEKGEGNV